MSVPTGLLHLSFPRHGRRSGRPWRRVGPVAPGPTARGPPAPPAGLGRIVAPAGETVPIDLRFRFNPLQVGPAMAAQVSAVAAGAGSLDFRVAGPLELQAPGLGSHRVDAAALLTGTLR